MEQTMFAEVREFFRERERIREPPHVPTFRPAPRFFFFFFKHLIGKFYCFLFFCFSKAVLHETATFANQFPT